MHLRISARQAERQLAAVVAALDQLPPEVLAVVRRTVAHVHITTSWRGQAGIHNGAFFCADPYPHIVFRGPLVARLPRAALAPLVAHEAAHAWLYATGQNWHDEDACNVLVLEWGFDVGALLAVTAPPG